MGFIPLILDSTADYSPRNGGSASVLPLPVGTGSVLEYILEQVAQLQPRLTVFVSPAGEALSNRIAETSESIRIVSPEDLDPILDDLDGSDACVVLDTKSWPAQWPLAADWRETVREYRGATHAVAVGATLERAIERIERDGDGQVRRIHRLYATANWPEVAGDAIAYSIVPACSMVGLRFQSLGELRRELAARGVLSRDKPLAVEVMNLSQAKCYLALSERTVARRGVGQSVRGYEVRPGGIVLGEGARVAASARLIPPVIVREGSAIDERALIVGPALIGPGALVQANAVVAQSVVLTDAVVSAGSIVRHEVYVGGGAAGVDDDAVRPANLRLPWGGQWAAAPPVFTEHRPARHRRVAMAVKRWIDCALAGAALVVLSPLLLLIGVLIKLDSSGPVLFGHVRERRGGKDFKCLKFRTMVPDADMRQRELAKANQVDGPQFKLTNDPRVTRVGRWLRATNLDELPQLINVLAGHMSLVGPRPSPFRENQICAAWRHARLSVRPGITGLWQICRAPDRSQGDFHEWIYYDMAYIRHFSIRLDFKILLATLLTLGGHRRVPSPWLLRGLDGFGRRSHSSADA